MQHNSLEVCVVLCRLSHAYFAMWLQLEWRNSINSKTTSVQTKVRESTVKVISGQGNVIYTGVHVNE